MLSYSIFFSLSLRVLSSRSLHQVRSEGPGSLMVGSPQSSYANTPAEQACLDQRRAYSRDLYT